MEVTKEVGGDRRVSINQERTSQCTTLPEDIDRGKTGRIMDASVEDDARGVLSCSAEKEGQSRCRLGEVGVQVFRTRYRRWRSVVQRKGRGCGAFGAGLKQIWCFAVLYCRSIMRSGSPGRNGEKGPQRRRGLALAHRERGVSEVSKSRCEGCALWGSLSQRAAEWANASSCMQLPL